MDCFELIFILEFKTMKRSIRLLTILAVNSLAAVLRSAQTGTNHMKYEQLYNKIRKDLDKNKSNNENYKLLEKS